jgi:glutamate synthase (NADPH/NADH) large chain
MTGGTIVILGKTGRNFAAGMSGGIAYIYDQDNQFVPLCNKAIVDLEKIEAGGEQHPQGNSLEALKSDMTKYDEQRLKLIISRHLQYTNSNVAKKILANWDKSLSKFIKVMPVDYRRALLEKQAKEAQQTASTGGQ